MVKCVFMDFAISFFHCGVLRILYILYILVLCQICGLKYFLLAYSLSFYPLYMSVREKQFLILMHLLILMIFSKNQHFWLVLCFSSIFFFNFIDCCFYFYFLSSPYFGLIFPHFFQIQRYDLRLLT